MSEALERIIAEQQKKIDGLNQMITGHGEQFQRLHTRLDAAFEWISKTRDLQLSPDLFKDEAGFKKWGDHSDRLLAFMLDNYYCPFCRAFNCECDDSSAL